MIYYLPTNLPRINTAKTIYTILRYSKDIGNCTPKYKLFKI